MRGRFRRCLGSSGRLGKDRSDLTERDARGLCGRGLYMAFSVAFWDHKRSILQSGIRVIHCLLF